MGVPQEVTIAVLAVLVVGALVGMVAGWRRRTARTGAALGALPAPPEQLGDAVTTPIAASYVATTSHDAWLERVTAHGLGARGRATVTVHASGLAVERAGAPDLVLPAAALRRVARSSGMVGKFVGDASIVVVTWAASGPDGTEVLLDTGLRPDHRSERDLLEEAVRSILATTDPAPKEQQ